MFIRVAVLVAALAFVSASSVAGEDPPKGLAELTGTWAVVGHDHNGRSAPKERLKGHKFVVTGATLRMVTPSGNTDFHVAALGPDKEPRTIDLTNANPQDPFTLRGIYKLEKGQVTIAVNMKTKGSVRPTKFEATAGSDVMLWVLRREES